MTHKTDFEYIRDVNNLLKSVVNVSDINKVSLSRLTALGENYGSLILKLDVHLKDDNEEQEKVLGLVAKKIPIEEMFRENFNVQVTFKNEVALYETIVPILQDFQKEHGIDQVFDCIPKFYCARFNLDGSERVTDDAVLVLENLSTKGYSNVERREGFNLASTKLILQDLAEFHAIPLALKLKRPKVFEEKLKKYCNTFIFNSNFHKIFFKSARAVIEENPNCGLLQNRISLLGEVDNPEASEPFGTLVHADLWSNNTMQKFTNDRTAIKNKFLDFQFLAYGSPASDFLFFVFTSVQLNVLKNNLDELISTYHNHFVDVLKKFSIDIEPFTLEKFIEEIKTQTKFEIGHVLQFVLYILNVEEKDRGFKLDADKLHEIISPKAKEHTWFIIEEWNRRGWL